SSSLSISITESSRNPDLAWEFIKLVAMDKNEVTDQLLNQFDLNSSIPVTAALKDDPFYQVKLKSMPFIKKDFPDLNVKYYAVVSMLGQGLADLILKGGNYEEFQHGLTSLAHKLDQEITK